VFDDANSTDRMGIYRHNFFHDRYAIVLRLPNCGYDNLMVGGMAGAAGVGGALLGAVTASKWPLGAKLPPSQSQQVEQPKKSPPSQSQPVEEKEKEWLDATKKYILFSLKLDKQLSEPFKDMMVDKQIYDPQYFVSFFNVLKDDLFAFEVVNEMIANDRRLPNRTKRYEQERTALKKEIKEKVVGNKMINNLARALQCVFQGQEIMPESEKYKQYEFIKQHSTSEVGVHILADTLFEELAKTAIGINDAKKVVELMR